MQLSNYSNILVTKLYSSIPTNLKKITLLITLLQRPSQKILTSIRPPQQYCRQLPPLCPTHPYQTVHDASLQYRQDSLDITMSVHPESLNDVHSDTSEVPN
ncbi:hypothetical protein SS50377_25167 [Spironucleus salmonicida]|uniref:Uncharacterized protein n=1 Tax=Spironucleus salmonicida TaxID=348837 RepID=A0A9P8RXI9_9EUKA|nr:hypothetical protein SS50377_25167 [Spironucleus salmonicida]